MYDIDQGKCVYIGGIGGIGGIGEIGEIGGYTCVRIEINISRDKYK